MKLQGKVYVTGAAQGIGAARRDNHECNSSHAVTLRTGAGLGEACGTDEDLGWRSRVDCSHAQQSGSG